MVSVVIDMRKVLYSNFTCVIAVFVVEIFGFGSFGHLINRFEQPCSTANIVLHRDK